MSGPNKRRIAEDLLRCAVTPIALAATSQPAIC